MEIYDHHGLFEFDGKCFKLKDNPENLEKVCKEKADTDLLYIKDELHEFRFYLEMNKFLHRKINLPQLPIIFSSTCHLIDKETGLETEHNAFSPYGLPDNSEISCYGIFGYLTLSKDKIKIHRDIIPYSEFLKLLSATLHDNNISACLKGYRDDDITKGLILNPLRNDRRRFFLHKGGNAFKYISHQYNKLQLELINLDLEYLVEIENSVLQTLEKQENNPHLIKHFKKEPHFKDKLYQKTKLLEDKFKNVLEYLLTLAIEERDEGKLGEIEFKRTLN